MLPRCHVCTTLTFDDHRTFPIIYTYGQHAETAAEIDLQHQNSELEEEECPQETQKTSWLYQQTSHPISGCTIPRLIALETPNIGLLDDWLLPLLPEHHCRLIVVSVITLRIIEANHRYQQRHRLV